MPHNCDCSTITCLPSSSPSLADLAVYPSTRATSAPITVRNAGPPALMGTDVQTQGGERNLSLRSSFFRSTFFGTPFRRGSNLDNLSVTSYDVRAPRDVAYHRIVRRGSVLPRPRSPNPYPAIVFPRPSRLLTTKMGMEREMNLGAHGQNINGRAVVVDPPTLVHILARVGCGGMLALLDTLGRGEVA